MPPTLQSTEEEIIEFCRKESVENPGFGHEMKLSYGLNLLLIKQQQKLAAEQSIYNAKQLEWSKGLTYATWFLVLVTLLLVKFSG